jgi:ubiquinone/menaquinone biosynthesis C-methylase UbiE
MGHSYYRYFSFGLDRAIDKTLYRIRKEIVELFVMEFSPLETDRVLDVGISGEDHASANIFEKHYPHTHRITAAGMDHHKELEKIYPGLRFVRADGRALSLHDRSFDYVFSHAVIEHVGSQDQQTQFMKEAFRVSRKGVFITTPNRWHPIETHVGLPFLHYFPSGLCHSLYKVLGKSFYGTERNLHLLSRRTFRALWARALPGPDWESSIKAVKWLGASSNLILIAKRQVLPQTLEG